VSESADPAEAQQTVFSINADGGAELRWLAEDRLEIRYWAPSHVLRRLNRAGRADCIPPYPSSVNSVLRCSPVVDFSERRASRETFGTFR
jgi:hypothetical protein